jgi:heme-degrading monooxygenase HmoA
VLTLPPPPYTAVIFSAHRTPDDEEGYAAAAARMEEMAARQEGYLGVESARGPDGFGITVSYWRTEADARAWKAIAEHAAAQAEGRRRWYAAYDVRVATVGRAYADPARRTSRADAGGG